MHFKHYMFSLKKNKKRKEQNTCIKGAHDVSYELVYDFTTVTSQTQANYQRCPVRSRSKTARS